MIDIIIPTYRRIELLKRVLPYYLKQRNVGIIIIVEDGPLSPEVAALALEASQPRIIAIATGHQSGAPAAKALGLQHAVSELVAFGEDDAFPAPDYYTGLAAHIDAGRADVIAGAVHYLSSIDDAWKTGTIALIENRPSFGVTNEMGGLIQCAATQAIYLGRRDLLLRYLPDSGFGGNGWREETDPQLRMWSDGKKIALDPSAIFYHLPRAYQKGGGQHARSRLTYEYWCLRNDMCFFRRHHASLSRLGFRGPALFFALMQSVGRLGHKIATRVRPAKRPRTVVLPRLGDEA